MFSKKRKFLKQSIILPECEVVPQVLSKNQLQPSFILIVLLMSRHSRQGTMVENGDKENVSLSVEFIEICSYPLLENSNKGNCFATFLTTTKKNKIKEKSTQSTPKKLTLLAVYFFPLLPHWVFMKIAFNALIYVIIRK